MQQWELLLQTNDPECRLTGYVIAPAGNNNSPGSSNEYYSTVTTPQVTFLLPKETTTHTDAAVGNMVQTRTER